jgi:hypothetical protein
MLAGISAACGGSGGGGDDEPPNMPLRLVPPPHADNRLAQAPAMATLATARAKFELTITKHPRAKILDAPASSGKRQPHKPPDDKSPELRHPARLVSKSCNIGLTKALRADCLTGKVAGHMSAAV